jgi:hypothetical protein
MNWSFVFIQIHVLNIIDLCRNNLGKDSAADIDGNGFLNCKYTSIPSHNWISVKILLQTLTEMASWSCLCTYSWIVDGYFKKDKTDTVFALPDEFLSKGFLSFVAFAYSKSGNTKATSNMLEEILLGGGWWMMITAIIYTFFSVLDASEKKLSQIFKKYNV